MTIKIFISFIPLICLQASYLSALFAQNTNTTRKDSIQVTVDNHKMSLYVSGTGRYTVVLEAGGASNHRCWRNVDTTLSKFTRVVSYDRPGYLKSEICSKERDALTVAKELRQALQHAGQSPPYILVGWSLGGAFARVFCGLYPESVVGLILIDPTPEDVYERGEKEFPELMAEDSAYLKELFASTNRPGERSENMVFDSSMNQARISDATHSTPTTLLIATYGKAPGKFQNDPSSPLNRLWVEELEKWATKRPNLHYEKLSCGHHIAKEQPDRVIKAVSEMITMLEK